jgi:hypothetical protein
MRLPHSPPGCLPLLLTCLRNTSPRRKHCIRLPGKRTDGNIPVPVSALALLALAYAVALHGGCLRTVALRGSFPGAGHGLGGAADADVCVLRAAAYYPAGASHMRTCFTAHAAAVRMRRRGAWAEALGRQHCYIKRQARRWAAGLLAAKRAIPAVYSCYLPVTYLSLPALCLPAEGGKRASFIGVPANQRGAPAAGRAAGGACHADDEYRRHRARGIRTRRSRRQRRRCWRTFERARLATHSAADGRRGASSYAGHACWRRAGAAAWNGGSCGMARRRLP